MIIGDWHSVQFRTRKSHASIVRQRCTRCCRGGCPRRKDDPSISADHACGHTDSCRLSHSRSKQGYRGRRLVRLLCRHRTGDWITSLTAARLALRHQQLRAGILRGYGGTRFLAAETKRNGQQAAIAVDTIKLMDALGINQATIAGLDWGARTADIVAALWPERCKALVSVSGYLIGNQSAGKGATAAVRRTSVVVSILFRHRSRSRRLREIPERLRQVYLAARLPTLEIRRRNVLAKRRRIRQSRPCGDRRP